MLDLISLMGLSIINDDTRIMLHTGGNVGIVCGNPHYEYFCDYYYCLVDSFIWFSQNELHVYLTDSLN